MKETSSTVYPQENGKFCIEVSASDTHTTLSTHSYAPNPGNKTSVSFFDFTREELRELQHQITTAIDNPITK